MKLSISIVFILITLPVLYSQQTGTVKGRITDEKGEPLPGATIIDLTSQKGVNADANGNFILTVPANRKVDIEISFIGFRKDTISISAATGGLISVNVSLKATPDVMGEVVVESLYDRAEALRQISIRSFDLIPLPSGNIESLLTTMGASSRNEMSSQYSVRGGNYDENLIYVNGIEVYKPMLVKAGQQEGMSFVNPALISSIQFAAGGFDARYGDKMSSVLDIRYKRPSRTAGSISAGMLGASAHVEGAAMKQKLTYITGVRYKRNRYLLNSLETEGDYKPGFFDLQTFITYDPVEKIEISFLGNWAVNTYNVIPQSRETAFGTFQQPMKFTVFYEGQEKDRFSTLLGALTADYRPNDDLSLRFTGSAYNTFEKIAYDILGEYWIDLLDNTPGSETAGDSILNIGVGGNLLHARNYLDARIYNLMHNGSFGKSQYRINWGISAQNESFTDKIREWELIDSAGYSMPYSDEELNLKNVVISSNNIEAWRFSGYLHNVVNISAGDALILLNTGIRTNYLTTNRQLLFSPRIRTTVLPSWEKKVSFHAALGWYHQPPFYKEMRDPSGNLHKDIKAQQSIHILAGAAWDFQMWERPFRFTTEAYYKDLNHLVPYIIDDVEIQYLPQYTARGYATGIEFKLNGEFVKDAESWATLSFLQTREDRKNDRFGSYPRATNQLVNFGFFFQDYFPNNPSYRVHLNIYYGSRLPYNSFDYDNPEKYFHLRSYQRIDIGMSKSVMVNRHGIRRMKNSFVDDLSFGFEVFNLFGFKNQASYLWIKTVSNQEGFPNVFAVPNYLTGRLVNLRVTLKI